MSKGVLFALLLTAAVVTLTLTVGGHDSRLQCADDEALGPEGQCLKPYSGEYTPVAPPPGFVVDPPPVTVDYDQVARMNAEAQARLGAADARREVKQDMREAVQDALREERRRKDDYSY